MKVCHLKTRWRAPANIITIGHRARAVTLHSRKSGNIKVAVCLSSCSAVIVAGDVERSEAEKGRF